MSTRRPHRGFTLLELLLAMALAAVLSLTLYTSFSTAVKARRTAQNAVRSARAGAVAMDLICHDLESVVPPPAAPADGTAATLTLAGPFEGQHGAGGRGDNDHLLFRTIEAEANANENLNDPLAEGVREVEFYIATDTNPPGLVRRVNRNVLATVQKPGDAELLCRGVRGFSVQYFDGSAWQTDWDPTQNGDVLPYAVRVTLDIEDPRPVQPGVEPAVQRISRRLAGNRFTIATSA